MTSLHKIIKLIFAIVVTILIGTNKIQINHISNNDEVNQHK